MFKASLSLRVNSFKLNDCVIDKTVWLTASAFDAFACDMNSNSELLLSNDSIMFVEDKSICHCLLVACKEKRCGILVCRLEVGDKKAIVGSFVPFLPTDGFLGALPSIDLIHRDLDLTRPIQVKTGDYRGEWLDAEITNVILEDVGDEDRGVSLDLSFSVRFPDGVVQRVSDAYGWGADTWRYKGSVQSCSNCVHGIVSGGDNEPYGSTYAQSLDSVECDSPALSDTNFYLTLLDASICKYYRDRQLDVPAKTEDDVTQSVLSATTALFTCFSNCVSLLVDNAYAALLPGVDGVNLSLDSVCECEGWVLSESEAELYECLRGSFFVGFFVKLLQSHKLVESVTWVYGYEFAAVTFVSKG